MRSVISKFKLIDSDTKYHMLMMHHALHQYPEIFGTNTHILEENGINNLMQFISIFPKLYYRTKNTNDFLLLRSSNTVYFICYVSKVFCDKTYASCYISQNAHSKGRRVLFLNTNGNFNNLYVISNKLRHAEQNKQLITLSGSYIGRSKNNIKCELVTMKAVHYIGVYNTQYGISAAEYQRMLHDISNMPIKDHIPSAMLKEYDLVGIKSLVEVVHGFLHTQYEYKEFQALYKKCSYRIEMERSLSKRKRLLLDDAGVNVREQSKNILKHTNSSKHRKFLASIPYPLTPGQHSALHDIFNDITKQHTTTRLIQGDVGCGKTIVMVATAIQIADNGMQTIVMVPSTLLALQHYEYFTEHLKAFDIKVVLLTGNMTSANKMSVIESMKRDKACVVIGTTSCLRLSKYHHNIGCVITDENHKFGMYQQIDVAHYKIMFTATPMPRDLLLTSIGALHFSCINDKPNQLKPVKTYIIAKKQTETLVKSFKNLFTQQKQVYWVCPIYSKGAEKIRTRSVVEAYEQIVQCLRKNDIHATVACIRGGQISKDARSENERIINQFRINKIDILVSTTIVEVGIHIPNASVMIIDGAAHYGTATLHQLRGRVGRGTDQGYCILISHQNVHEVGASRLKNIKHNFNGLTVAQNDAYTRLGLTVDVVESAQESMVDTIRIINTCDALIREKYSDIYYKKVIDRICEMWSL